MHPRVHALSQPDKLAVVMSTTGGSLTYAELERRANRVAQALRALGVNSGDTFALATDNRIEFFEIYWGAQRAGATLVLLSSRLKRDEITYIVGDSAAKLILVSSALEATVTDLAADQATLPGVGAILSIGPVAGLSDWNGLCKAQPDEPIGDERVGGRMVYSSGTTGRPKGLRFDGVGTSPVQPNPAADLFGRLYGFDRDTVYLAPAPLYHSAPMGMTVCNQSLGGTVVLMPKFDPEEFLRAIEQWRVTTVMVVPTMFIRLLALPDEVRGRYDLSSLKRVIHAAAPCPIPVKQAMIEWFGPIIDEFYAGSEGNGHVRITSPEWLQRPGSVGRAVLGELHICDDAGNELPAGEIGTIYFGGGRPITYHNDPGKTASVHNPKQPGWSTLGDVGHVDAEGYLYLSDRKDFMIISGGVNIYPQEVENLLAFHPDVADVAVFGVPNAQFGEEVKAVVQPRDWDRAGAELGLALIAWCRERLADVKCPRSVDFAPELPRAENGKLYKKELKATYWPKA